MAQAADVTIKVLGFFGNQPQIDDVDRPMWESIEADSGGRIEVQYHPQMVVISPTPVTTGVTTPTSKKDSIS